MKLTTEQRHCTYDDNLSTCTASNQQLVGFLTSNCFYPLTEIGAYKAT